MGDEVRWGEKRKEKRNKSERKMKEDNGKREKKKIKVLWTFPAFPTTRVVLLSVKKVASFKKPQLELFWLRLKLYQTSYN